MNNYAIVNPSYSEPKTVMMLILLLLVEQVVVMTTYGATGDDKFGIMVWWSWQRGDY